MSVVRAVVVRVKRVHPRSNAFDISYKVLKKGPKKERYMYQSAKDELDALLQAQERLRNRGYKV